MSGVDGATRLPRLGDVITRLLTGCLVAGMILFGLGMTALVTSLGGLFATDICPKRVAGAAMGLIGVFSYLGAAIQEQVSGALIDKGHRVLDGRVRRVPDPRHLPVAHQAERLSP